MTSLLIGLLLIAAFGPILWLLPSQRDRRLSRLRMQARRKGLIVEMARLAHPHPRSEDRVSSGGVVRVPTIKCASYRMLAASPLVELQPWRVASDGSEASANLVACHEDLPSDWLAVEVDRHGACLYWREQVDDENLDNRLEAVARVLASLLAAHREGGKSNERALRD